MWGLQPQAKAKAGTIDDGRPAQYTVMFKSEPVAAHLARQPAPPRISSGRPGSIGRIDMRSPEATS